MFPDVQHLYCVRHLMQRDEQKINCLLQKLDYRENERLPDEKCEVMRSYTPTPSDAFDKPSNAGRKPGSIIRRRKEQPTQVLVDRIQNSQET